MLTSRNEYGCLFICLDFSFHWTIFHLYGNFTIIGEKGVTSNYTQHWVHSKRATPTVERESVYNSHFRWTMILRPVAERLAARLSLPDLLT